MQDGIIAGNGNSRYLKTVSAALGLYPTYEDFMAALITGTFPIDLNGINADGWTQQGTPLNKANLFSDTTASALGLTTDKTPNDALAKIKTLIDSAQSSADAKSTLLTGSYLGTGGSNVQVSFQKQPKLLYIDGGNVKQETGYCYGMITMYGSLYGVVVSSYANGATVADLLWSGTSLTISNNYLNMSGVTYNYICIY